MTKKIDVVPYNPEWPKHFETEADLIKHGLGDHCVEIHHVGSTAVPGLAAKPIIDIIVIIKNPAHALLLLETVGFLRKDEYNIPLRYYFTKRGAVDINLHAYQEDHPEIELNLTFRDYLRNNSTAKQAYESIKYELLQDTKSFEKGMYLFTGYTLGKRDFINSILNQAGFKRIRMLKCTDDTEWDIARHFRNTYFFDLIPLADPYTWTFTHPDHTHLILYQGTCAVGYAHVQLWHDARAALRIIVIDEGARNQGFGKQFLSLIEAWLASKQYKTLHTEASPKAVAFYQKLGFTPMPFDDPDGHESDPRDIPLGKKL